jgi:hypothetical protein
MNKVTKIWTDLDDLKTDVQVSNYWEANHPQIIKHLKSCRHRLQCYNQNLI